MRFELDETDLSLLRELQRDGTLSTAELGKRVGLSASPCWRRVKRLEEGGVIRGRVAVLDPAALGLDLSAFALITLSRHVDEDIDAFHEALARAPEVTSCYAVTGAVDFIVTVMVPDMAGYERFLRTRLLHLTMIRSINTSFVLREVKASTALPLD